MKTILKFLSIGMLVFNSGLLGSCNNNSSNSNSDTISSSEHKHSFSSPVITKEATCKEEGIRTFICDSCDFSYTEVITKLPHTLKFVVEEDEHYQKCEKCDYVSSKEKHNYATLISKITATCLVEGKEVYQCVCEKTKEISLGIGNHTYNSYNYDANTHWQVCETCKESHTNQVKHTFTEQIVKKVTCEVDGKKKFTCICGYSYEETITSTGHDLDYSNIVSRTQSGHYYNCKNCNQKVAVAHNYEEVDCEYNRPSTCYQDGHQDYKCFVCDFVTHRNLGKNNDHNFTSRWTYNGTHHWHNCLNGDGKCEEKDEYGEHSFTNVRQEPTCVEDGRINTVCVVCGYLQKYEIIKASGHEYKEEILKNATCLEVGQVKKTCNVCGDEVIEDIPLTKHTWNEYAYDVTNHWHKCSICGVEQESKVNHTLKEEVIKAATCTNPGESKFTCSVCGYSITKETTKNHAYHFDDNATDATCIEVSHWTETCEYCGDTIEVSGKEYAPHTIEYHERVEATEEKEGNNPYWECLVCYKYFKSKDCSVELSLEDIIIPATKEVITNLSLLEGYGNALQNNETSTKIYEIKAKVALIDLENNQVMVIDDNGNDFLIQFLASANINTLNEDDIITVKFNLTKDENGEISTTNVTIVNVESAEKLYSIYITGNDYVSYNYCSASSTNNAYITDDTFNILEKGETITITIYHNSTIKPVLKINGVEIVVKPVENKNDESIATFVVDGDVHIELSSK